MTAESINGKQRPADPAERESGTIKRAGNPAERESGTIKCAGNPAERIADTAEREQDIFTSGKRLILVELDSPAEDNAETFLNGVRVLRDAGADMITIADNPMGRPRADSCLTACRIHREYGVNVLPHLTCRDRNLNAVRSVLLGLSMEGIHNILLVTGDPIPKEDRQTVKPVFHFHSRQLAQSVREWNQAVFRTPFRIFGALNVNARQFEQELQRAVEKESCGMEGFLTQPVLSETALENVKTARKILKGRIFGGIFPPVSYRNACFLNEHVPGIRISEEIISRYEGKDRTESEQIAVEIAEQCAAALEPYTDGLYLMTPFSRVNLMADIIHAVRNA